MAYYLYRPTVKQLVLWLAAYRIPKGIPGNLETFPALRLFSNRFPFCFETTFLDALDSSPRAATERKPVSPEPWSLPLSPEKAPPPR